MYAARVARQVTVDDDVASCSNVSFATEDILVDCLFKAATSTDEDAHVTIVVGRRVEHAHQYAALAIELHETLAIAFALLCHLQVSIGVAKFEFEEEEKEAGKAEKEDAERFEEIYDTPVVKTKKFELRPMDVDEAILEMEMLGHNFFVYLDMETNSVNVVYKRNGGSYGVLETTY